jgi:TfoX/Sxy family transcriptional regulator of competence genes
MPADREMPAFSKSPPELVERFGAAATRHPETQRQMFGYPALFVGGNLTTSLFRDRWVVRLPDADRAELLALPGAGSFEPVAGRPMTGYALLPTDVVDDETALDAWIERAIAFVRTLPAK